jgi:hypothetical protein
MVRTSPGYRRVDHEDIPQDRDPPAHRRRPRERRTHALAVADNAAVAINTKDDVYVSRQAFKVTRVFGDVVDESNGAAAVSSCERCRTAAVAFQVIDGDGVERDVERCRHLNQECLSCATTPAPIS